MAEGNQPHSKMSRRLRNVSLLCFQSFWGLAFITVIIIILLACEAIFQILTYLLNIDINIASGKSRHVSCPYSTLHVRNLAKSAVHQVYQCDQARPR